MGASRSLLRKMLTTTKHKGVKPGTHGRHLRHAHRLGPWEWELHVTKGWRVRRVDA